MCIHPYTLSVYTITIHDTELVLVIGDKVNISDVIITVVVAESRIKLGYLGT